MSKRFRVTVEYDVWAEDEADARSTNFWCNELNDEGFVASVDELQPNPPKEAA